jgi:Fe(3+) dicitrate transport protein
MDFENQIVPASVAGGLGATLTNAGRTLHQGMELATQVEWRDAFGTGQSLYWRTSYTWLPIARFESERTSAVSGFSSVRITGNRLPYAAENLLSSSVTWVHRRGMTAMVECVYTGRQFADDLNTVAGSADGQRGLLPGNAIWNLTVNYPVEGMRTTLFFSAKNLFDRLSIADRSRGILPGAPRIVQAGLQWGF